MDQTSTVYSKPSSFEKRKTRIAQNVDSVEELVLSQENTRALTNNSSDARDRNSQHVSA